MRAGDTGREAGRGSVAADPLSGPQAARRQRVVDAAMALASDGGYEAVQMRDVAARAGVAMGTVYRYFTSKDHLLAAVLASWAAQLEQQLAKVPPGGGEPADRLTEVLGRAARSMNRRPELLAAVMAALSSSDPAVVECQQQVSATIERVIRRAVGEPSPDDIDDLVRILGHVWYSMLVGWLNGRSNVGRIGDELQLAARLLFRAGQGRL